MPEEPKNSWNSNLEAMLLLLTVGFEAGRAYQQENPDDDTP